MTCNCVNDINNIGMGGQSTHNIIHGNSANGYSRVDIFDANAVIDYILKYIYDYCHWYYADGYVPEEPGSDDDISKDLQRRVKQLEALSKVVVTYNPN